MIIVKLSSANYLIWHSQILPLIESQDLVGHVDGSIVPPPKFDSPNSQTPNDKYLAWKAIDQRLLCLLRSFLTEEALADIVGLSTAHDVWLALETTFNHEYKTREIHLKDELQSMKRATRSVMDIARVFKGFCDELHTTGRLVDNTDKVHWFLCGFGAKFSSLSSAQMALAPLPSFVDLVSRAKSFELFQKSCVTYCCCCLHYHRSQLAAKESTTLEDQSWTATSHLWIVLPSSALNQGRNYGQARRPPRCHIYCADAHFTDQCPQHYSHASTAHIAEAFNDSCSLHNSERVDWSLNMGALAHVFNDPSILDHAKSYNESSNKKSSSNR
ncbi:PREDICTED: uncharacterized protein LOC105141219 [Populus euphratica]|uniref:Uncharacterized protein LOC105141219 n=1 Tax=Populus euphratica TaxID=75702 RepID=A0AAJ6VE12_POPEU|nr:PREDICTED: uncharacterized protein LOC105141219 [Populus euphratica]